ncbi:MAG: hypothetical protein ACKOW2_02960 [Sphingobacteriaceae bacterium]
MNWIYRIGLLLDMVLLIYAAFNIRASGVYNRTVIICIFLLVALIAAAYLLKNYYHQIKTAVTLLYIPIVPTVLFLLFILLFLIIKPDFK